MCRESAPTLPFSPGECRGLTGEQQAAFVPEGDSFPTGSSHEEANPCWLVCIPIIGVVAESTSSSLPKCGCVCQGPRPEASAQ